MKISSSVSLTLLVVQHFRELVIKFITPRGKCIPADVLTQLSLATLKHNPRSICLLVLPPPPTNFHCNIFGHRLQFSLFFIKIQDGGCKNTTIIVGNFFALRYLIHLNCAFSGSFLWRKFALCLIQLESKRFYRIARKRSRLFPKPRVIVFPAEIFQLAPSKQKEKYRERAPELNSRAYISRTEIRGVELST